MNYPYFNQMQTPQQGVGAMNPNITSNNQNIAPPLQVNYNQMVQPAQTLFPTPIGSVYSLNTAADIGNIPAGTSMSLGLCLQENILYIKALQNGSPMLLGYKLVPLEGSSKNSDQDFSENNEKFSNFIEEINIRLDKLTEQVQKIKTKVGDKEWQL